MSAKITATFPDGTVATRTTDADYRYASKVNGRVVFHSSYSAARDRAGIRRSDRFVVRTDFGADAVPVAPKTTTWVCFDSAGTVVCRVDVAAPPAAIPAARAAGFTSAVRAVRA